MDCLREIPLPVGPKGVRLWYADDAPAVVASAERALCLSTQEWHRADRFRFDADRHRYVARRTLLREVLGRAVNREPQTLVLHEDPLGKPILHGHALHFNLSERAGHVLIGLSAQHRIGVDLEVMNTLSDFKPIARHFFAPEEAQALEVLHGQALLHAFYRCWTRKEAVVKALGLGLSLDLRGFTVPVNELADNAPTRIRVLDEHWTLLGLQPAPDVMAALVFG